MNSHAARPNWIECAHRRSARPAREAKQEGIDVTEDLPIDRERQREPNIDPVDPLPRALLPSRAVIEGRYCIVEPLDPAVHAGDLFEASHSGEGSEAIWAFLPYGPFASQGVFHGWLRTMSASPDPLIHAIRDRKTGRASGQAGLLAIEPLNGSIEIGHIVLGLPLQNTAAGTEALFLLMSHVMDDLRYRRLEWKCDAMNAPSRRAARRLGFAYEGLFYNHRVVKARNRDTAWYSILDSEWPAVRACFEQWLDPENFDQDGRQRSSLSDLTRGRRE
jgi:RimJ/RimL family protein N-acetyltransferase